MYYKMNPNMMNPNANPQMMTQMTQMSQPKVSPEEIMSYEDVLKDLNATTEVVYEELNNKPPMDYVENKQPMEENVQQYNGTPQMPVQHVQQDQMPVQHYHSYPPVHTGVKSDKEFSSWTTIKNTNDVLFVVLSYIVTNNKYTLDILKKQFPILFDETTPSVISLIVQAFILILMWYGLKQLHKHYCGKSIHQD